MSESLLHGGADRSMADILSAANEAASAAEIDVRAQSELPSHRMEAFQRDLIKRLQECTTAAASIDKVRDRNKASIQAEFDRVKIGYRIRTAEIEKEIMMLTDEHDRLTAEFREADKAATERLRGIDAASDKEAAINAALRAQVVASLSATGGQSETIDLPPVLPKKA